MKITRILATITTVALATGLAACSNSDSGDAIRIGTTDASKKRGKFLSKKPRKTALNLMCKVSEIIPPPTCRCRRVILMSIYSSI